MRNVIYFGIGRRKASKAKVRISPGGGNLIINNRDGEEYLQYNPTYIQTIKAPLALIGLENEYNLSINTLGGGLTGQAEAIKLGVSRALCELDLMNRIPLKSEGYLTRDSRVKERKKYGLKKARKAPQFSKR
uniref:Ribosomal protein S9 n=1 Tax=Sciadococcus taiwanensis TaxID=3028030 RepID=A0A9Y1I2C4_9RHOD|nr:ribosomal protein S9 [Sciadococcus taiwanensis]